MNEYLDRHPTLATGLKLTLVTLFALSVTLPFAGQAFSHDGPLVVDYASSQAENPLKQHLDDFDYFGFRYDQFTNTHPRFLSFYLSLVLRVFGADEVPVHLSLILFPVIGAISMYFLGRRFSVSGIGAGLLFLAGPIAMVSSHVEMVDMPGTCLWIASLTTFIYGVDRGGRLLLISSGLLFLLTIFTFYQGLSVLALALAYLVLNKRFSLKYFLPVIVPALLFVAYLFWFHRYYGEFPRFSYRIDLPYYDKTVWNQLRGLMVIIGGAAAFPLVTAIAFARNWRVMLVGLAAAACAYAWLVVRYILGDFSAYESLALGAFMAIGILVVYAVLEQTVSGFTAWFSKRNHDILLPAVWFFGILVYSAAFLGYPSPRYFLPAWPALVLITLTLWRGASFRGRYLRPLLAGAGLGLTLSYALIISISYMDYAEEARKTADWALREFGDHDGRVWFDGELGYAYYMRKNGFTMVPSIYWDRYSQTELETPAELPEPGDIIIASSLAGNWLPYQDILPYMRLTDTRKTWSEYPLVTWSYLDRSRWSTTLLLPYVISYRPLYTDEITVFEVVDEPAPLLPEVEQEVNKWT